MKQPLLIQINNPCHENWDEMTQVEQGKFCSHCQKTVIDFSEKTDAELFDYFNNHSSFCGRFKNTQIDRIIEEPKPVLKRLFNFYSKAAALFFTVFSFKSFQTNAQTKQPKIENFVRSADEIHHEKISIEGIIIDDENRLVDSVAIYFDNLKVATSNHLGYYKFEIENIALKNHVISFDKNQYRSFAFSFHPLMGNTKQDVLMCNYKGKDCSFSMGGIGPPSRFSGKIILYLKKNIKHELIDLAKLLRSNPNFELSFNTFYSKDSDKKLNEKKGQEIVNYLVDIQGIDIERLHLKIIKNSNKANIV